VNVVLSSVTFVDPFTHPAMLECPAPVESVPVALPAVKAMSATTMAFVSLFTVKAGV
jgi:hypothetical protein